MSELEEMVAVFEETDEMETTTTIMGVRALNKIRSF